MRIATVDPADTTLDALVARLYGAASPAARAALLAANPRPLADPTALPIGAVLVVPEVPGALPGPAAPTLAALAGGRVAGLRGALDRLQAARAAQIERERDAAAFTRDVQPGALYGGADPRVHQIIQDAKSRAALHLQNDGTAADLAARFDALRADLDDLAAALDPP